MIADRRAACKVSTHTSDMRGVEFRGIAYPPAHDFARSGEIRNAGHACENFELAEIDALVDALPGTRVAVEHMGETLVGVVNRARRTHAGGVEVEAFVEASTPEGEQAALDIINSNKVGLSLSHWYNIKAGDHCNDINLAISEGRDWTALPADRASVVRKIRELSICKEPFHKACFISDVVVCRSAVKARASEQGHATINTFTSAEQQELLAAATVCVFSCSSGGNMESTPMPASNITEAPTSQPNVAEPLLGDAQPGTPEVAPSDKEQGDETEVPSGDGAPAPGEESATPTEPTPSSTLATSNDALQRASALLAEKDRIAEDMAATTASQFAELTGRLEAMEKQAQKQKDTEAKLKSELEQKNAQHQAVEMATNADLMAQLTRQLDKHVAANLPQPPASGASPMQQLQYQNQVAKAAIESNMAATNQNRTMTNQNTALKRRHEDLGNTLAGFGGAPAGHAGLANASADDPNAPNARNSLNAPGDGQRSKKPAPGILAWHTINSGKTYMEVQHEHMRLQDENHQFGMQGLMNASATGRMSRAVLETRTESRKPYDPSMRGVTAHELYPEVMQDLLSSMTGRMPSEHETSSSIRSVPRGDDMQAHPRLPPAPSMYYQLAR